MDRPAKPSGSARILRIAIVDDEAGIRGCLQRVLTKSVEFQVVAVCEDAESALRILPTARPDVVLLDIEFPGMSGIQCLQFLKAVLPQTAVLMLTGHGDDDNLFRSIQAGADGYIVKPSTGPAILQAVREVAAGRGFVSPDMARRIFEYFRHPKDREKVVEAQPAIPPELKTLSAREAQILQKLAEGLSVKEVSSELRISWDTVRTHLAAIYDKLHVHSRTEAVLTYLGRPRSSM